jgi:hypothetical protein
MRNEKIKNGFLDKLQLEYWLIKNHICPDSTKQLKFSEKRLIAEWDKTQSQLYYILETNE